MLAELSQLGHRLVKTSPRSLPHPCQCRHHRLIRLKLAFEQAEIPNRFWIHQAQQLEQVLEVGLN